MNKVITLISAIVVFFLFIACDMEGETSFVRNTDERKLVHVGDDAVKHHNLSVSEILKVRVESQAFRKCILPFIEIHNNEFCVDKSFADLIDRVLPASVENKFIVKAYFNMTDQGFVKLRFSQILDRIFGEKLLGVSECVQSNNS